MKLFLYWDSNKGRSSWSRELSDVEAALFLSRSFIDGESWITNMPSSLQIASNLILKAEISSPNYPVFNITSIVPK
jgi:hypothetical protein